jgi:NADH dehydrogenase FAD-containing subunit
MGKKAVIIGGAAGGPSVAAEAKRQDPSLDIKIIEQGQHVSFAA